MLSALSPTSDAIAFDDYLRVETIMELWYNGGKMKATGHANGNVYEYDETSLSKSYTFGDKLATHCQVLNLAENDQVTYLGVRSGNYGVNRIELQTIEKPYYVIGYDDEDWYSHESQNWQRFDNGLQLSGIYGYADYETSKLNAFGFVVQDVECTNRFIEGVGRNALTWTSTIPGTEVVLPEVPVGVYLDYLPEPTPRHKHEKKADTGLITVCVLVYFLIAAMLVNFVLQFRKEQKNGLGSAPPNRSNKFSAE